MRFNHGLLFLMALALLVSFLPGTQRVQGTVDTFFTPISYPTRQLAHRVWKKTSDPVQRPSEKQDARPADQLRDEIETLKFQLAQKNQMIVELKDQLNEFKSIDKSLFDRCVVVKVTGGDAGTQAVLTLNASSAENFVTGMPVIYPHGLAGRVEVVGVGAARLRLVTDKAFPQMRVEFVRYLSNSGDFVHLPLPMKAAAGRGDGRLEVSQYKTAELSSPDKKYKLAIGDWVVLNDKDWPAPVQGIKIGEIETINDQKNPLFSTLIIRPDADLMKLQDVMVMVKK